jgi:hypothetical protein
MFTSVFTSVLSVECSWLLYTQFQHHHYFPVWTLPFRHFAHIRLYCKSWSLLLALRVPPISRVSPNNSVRIATSYGLDGSRGSGFPHRSRPALGPTLLLYHGYRVPFSAVQRHGRAFYHPPISSADVKERVYLYLPSPSGPSRPGLWWTLHNFSCHFGDTSRQFLLPRGEGSTCCLVVNTEFSTLRFQNASHRVTVTEVFVILLITAVEISVLYEGCSESNAPQFFSHSRIKIAMWKLRRSNSDVYCAHVCKYTVVR